MTHPNVPGLLLALHPTSRGFGWVLFEGPDLPVDFGTASAKANKSSRCMARFEELLDQYEPSTLVLEKYDTTESKRSERIRLLAHSMKGFATNRDIETLVYGKSEVASAMTGKPNSHRHAVALAAAAQLPPLDHLLPVPRRVWQTEGDRQSMFDAAALGLAHYKITRCLT